MDEILQEFLVESYENLDQLDRDLVALEQDPGSRELLSRIFRVIHTIKGTSGFLAFNKLESVTHTGENLLSRLRDGTQPMTAPTADALLLMVDAVRLILTTIEATGGEGEPAIIPVVTALTACISDGVAAPASTAELAPTAAPGALPETASRVPAHAAPDPEPPAAVPAAPPAEALPGQPAAPASATGEPAGIPAPPAAAPVEAPPAEAAPDDVPGPRRSVADTSVRVDVDLLDALMRIVGELVLTRNQLVRGVLDLGDQAVLRTSQRLNLLTSELQESVMKTRMQPIDHLFSKLPRVVRDLSALCGKRVRVVSEGRETELDRSLLEAVKDPLTHLVRNAVDHGIEPPDVRIERGKEPEGTMTLRAYHEGGHVLVEVEDNGGGIDPAVISRIAIERGVVTRDQLAVMEPREILHLVFRPGFSTAREVTNVSGRGVGMDVVKTNIERIGGAVDVESTVGTGTTWRLMIPLTLAIIQALTIDCGEERYAIPQSAVLELLFVDAQSGQPIEYVSGAPVYRLRGKLLPLVQLDDTLGLPSQSLLGRAVYVAVVQADGRRFGLVVDRVLSTEEIVVKPLSARFQEIGAYAGATILGDGRVALILDVQALARRAKLAGTSERGTADSEAGQETASGTGQRLLVVAVGDRRIGIPLDQVARLEQFAADRIERAGPRQVVQYRDQILPLSRLSDLLNARPEPDGDKLLVVVYTEKNRSAGLIVDRILDIVSGTASDSEIGGEGLTGSAVVQQRVTELLDVRRAIVAADPNFYAPQAGDLAEAADAQLAEAAEAAEQIIQAERAIAAQRPAMETAR